MSGNSLCPSSPILLVAPVQSAERNIASIIPGRDMPRKVMESPAARHAGEFMKMAAKKSEHPAAMMKMPAPRAPPLLASRTMAIGRVTKCVIALPGPMRRTEKRKDQSRAELHP